MIIRPLTSKDRRGDFKSGEHSLDDFFCRHAWDNHVNGISKVYVAVETEESDEVMGYYTLSAATVESSSIADQSTITLPRYPIPVFLIGRLAVDERSQGQGLGGALLRNALDRCLETAHNIASFGVLVHALNPRVVGFYEQYGFTKVIPEDWPQPMFLPMQTIAEAVQ